jgi:hypothetical protein
MVKNYVIVATVGCIFGVGLSLLLVKVPFGKQDQGSHINDFTQQVIVTVERDIRLLDAITRGNTNSATFLLEMDLDSSIIALYTTQERSGLDKVGSEALSAGIAYRKTHPFVRVVNGIDRGELVEDTVSRILKGESITGK